MSNEYSSRVIFQILSCFALFCSVLFCSVLLYSVSSCHVLMCHVLLSSVLSSSVLFRSFLFCTSLDTLFAVHMKVSLNQQYILLFPPFTVSVSF